MTLNIGSTLTNGVGRVANRNGALLILAYMALGVVWQVSFYSAFAAIALPPEFDTSALALPTIDGPLAVLAGGAVLSLLALQYLTIVAVRAFVGGHARSILSEYYTRNIVAVLVNSIVGSVAFGLLVFVGSLMLFVPGIIAYVAFIFTMIIIAVEDVNFVAALRQSWDLTRGHWLRLFVLLFVVVVGIGVVSTALSVAAQVIVSAIASDALGTLVYGVLTLPFSLLTLGILSEAFEQLRTEQTQEERFAEL